MSRPDRAILLVGLLLACAVGGGCKPAIRPGGGSSTTKASLARSQAETLAANVVVGAAAAQARAGVPASRDRYIGLSPGDFSSLSRPAPPGVPLAPPPPGGTVHRSLPRPGSPAVITDRVASPSPSLTESEAEADALEAARDALEWWLAALDPPVHYRPSLNEVRTEFIRKDSRAKLLPSEEFKRQLRESSERDKVIDDKEIDKLVYIAYDIEVTADQVRELRARDRVALSLKVLGMLGLSALTAFLFLRLDEWTKGYLTRYLTGAAVLLVGGAVATLYFV